MNQKERVRIRAKKWYDENKERALLSAKRRINNPKNKIKKREYDKKYRILNRDKIDRRVNNWYKNNKELVKNRARIWKCKNPERNQYARYVETARKRKDNSFGLNFIEFLEIIKMPCVYCGFNDGIVGLDRVDSKKGYMKDNIVPCCKVCNYMKLDHPVEEWFSAMKDIFENLGYDITLTSSTKTNSRE